MLAFLAILAIGSLRYEATLIYSEESFSGTIHCAVLTDAGLAAGYTSDLMTHHGHVLSAKPFVWIQDKLYRLPLGKKGREGIVLDGNDRMLVGAVDVKGAGYVPAQWIPGESGSWSSARLRVYTGQAGFGSHLGPDGSIWVTSNYVVKGRLIGENWEQSQFGNFELVGVAADGRLFGNRFRNRQFDGRPDNTTPGFYRGAKWSVLKVGEPTGDRYYARAKAVNSKGTVIGYVDFANVLWAGNTLQAFRKATLWALNDEGDMVGTVEGSKDDVLIKLWKKGKEHTVSVSLPKESLVYIERLNNGGVIAAHVARGMWRGLYLLRPKKR
ncbi:MAG: hypothetical protein HONBIEJF_01919 [Fimbriimonadaceae bacterium]|nr:hypothetical protein [Fimbriimonadaceae bacterium]